MGTRNQVLPPAQVGKTPPWARTILGIVAVMVVTGSVLWWDATSRQHAAHNLIFGGDVMLGRDVERWRSEGTDSFGGVRALLNQADQVVVNLESPLTTREDAVDKRIVLKASPDAVDVLVDASVTVALLANNHTFDYGLAGYLETAETLNGAGIMHVGAGLNEREALQPAVFDINGVDISVVAFSKYATDTVPAATPSSPGQASYVVSDVAGAIAEASRNSDLVVASFHFGREYFLEPTDNQRDVARRAIDAGADIVIGHHPHVTQPIEVYRGAPIFFSLGNLLFDQETPPRDRSFLVALDITETRMTFTLYPYLIRLGEITLMEPQAGREFLDSMGTRMPDPVYSITPEGTAVFSLPRRGASEGAQLTE